MMKLGVLFSLLLLISGGVLAADVQPDVILGFTEEAAHEVRAGLEPPQVITALSPTPPNLRPLFPIPKDRIQRQAFYDNGLHLYFELMIDSLTATELVERIPTGSGIRTVEPACMLKAHEIPDDFSIHNMWGLERMRLPEAWDLHFDPGAEIIISTVDTGCEIYHEDLADNIWINPGEDLDGNGIWDATDINGVDDDGNGYVDDIAGYDFQSWIPTEDFADGEEYGEPDNEVYPDVYGHGTHTMGTAAAVTNNGLGVAAASWNVKAMPLRGAATLCGVFNELYGSAYLPDFMEAIVYAIDNGADIISLSYGGNAYSQAFQDVISYAADSGVLVFCSAGNDVSELITYPAGYDGTIAVASSGQNDQISWFSNYGFWVDLCAPGESIWSTYSNNSYHEYDYASVDGTSMAAPNAASVAGLIWSYDPTLTPDDVVDILLETCRNLDDINPIYPIDYRGKTGAGRINAYAAIASLEHDDQWPRPDNLITSLNDQTGEVVLTWSMSIDDPDVQDSRRDYLMTSVRDRSPQVDVLNEGSGSNGNELDEFLHYSISRDGVEIGTSTTETYTDQLPWFAEYSYTIAAVYSDNVSRPTPETAVTWINFHSIVLDEDFNDGLPADWTVEQSYPDATWHIDWQTERFLFNSPYMLVDSDAAGPLPGAHLLERLVSPVLDLSDRHHVYLEFTHLFDEYYDEYGYVQYRVGTDEWQTVATYEESMNSPETVILDLTDQLAGADEAQIGFLYDDLELWGMYWGIDDVIVHASSTEANVTLAAAALNTSIPAEGGELQWELTIKNNTGSVYDAVKFWTYVLLPNGNRYGPLVQHAFQLHPLEEIRYNTIVQTIPETAPAGEYTFVCNLGRGFQNALITDQFTFSKLGELSSSGRFDPSGWTCGELTRDNEPVAANLHVGKTLPHQFSLLPATPNPFNPTTTITVAIPEMAALKLAVYNVMGQQVATLADGPMSAGQHSFTLDGSTLASGLYFVHASLGDGQTRLQKITLLK